MKTFIEQLDEIIAIESKTTKNLNTITEITRRMEMDNVKIIQMLSELLEDDGYESEMSWEDGVIDNLQHRIEKLETGIKAIINAQVADYELDLISDVLNGNGNPIEKLKKIKSICN